jgi:hypothetical protein
VTDAAEVSSATAKADMGNLIGFCGLMFDDFMLVRT